MRERGCAPLDSQREALDGADRSVPVDDTVYEMASVKVSRKRTDCWPVRASPAWLDRTAPLLLLLPSGLGLDLFLDLFIDLFIDLDLEWLPTPLISTRDFGIDGTLMKWAPRSLPPCAGGRFMINGTGLSDGRKALVQGAEAASGSVEFS